MMRSLTRRLLPNLAVIAAALFGISCGEGAAPPFEPQSELMTTEVSTLSRPSQYVLRSTPAVAEAAVVVIDAAGGEVKAGGHILIVPRGAVTAPTAFRMEVLAGSFIQVDLSAVQVSDQAPVSRFPIALRLKLDYKSALAVNEGRLGVAYLVDGTVTGRQQRMPAFVDYSGRFVDGLISHFSTYALIVD